MSEKIINSLFDENKPLSDWSSTERAAVEEALLGLDRGTLRVAEFKDQKWVINQWLKKAILLYFKMTTVGPIKAGDLEFNDKIPLKNWKDSGVRVVPPAVARFGAHIEKGVILMPSFVNIGAYVATGTMVDTWATVGSCAQIGKSVHLSGGVGIGGVLEPLQAQPVVIEDHVFVGSRCIVVEGALIEEGSVLGAGVTITGSTKIIDVSESQTQTFVGRVPPRSVVIPGTYTKKFNAGEFGVPCALIIGKRKPSTDLKTSLNDALRDFGVSV